MKNELHEQLKKLAYQRSSAFCYHCYKIAPTGRCEVCGSDDLMRLLEGVGCEYGVEWIITHLLDYHLSPVDKDEAFEDHIRGCYPEEVQVGWMTLDPVQVMKDHDPISWKIARDEWETSLEEDDLIFSLDNGSKYYWVNEVEDLLEA